MIELSGEMPFLWRLSPESSDGYCSVSVVVECPPETEIKDLTIETNVLSLSSGDTRSEVEETLEWNHEDVNLFLRLINQRQSLDNEPLTETVRIDLVSWTATLSLCADSLTHHTTSSECSQLECCFFSIVSFS